jgi:long-chain-fatty-acyl-CoA reductase
MHFPFIVYGSQWTASSENLREITTPTNLKITTPLLNEEIVSKLLEIDRNMLQDVTTQEIISFLYNVGQNWKSEEYNRRRLYIRYLIKYLGYSEKMAEHEANWIAMLFSSHYYLYDMIACELGHRDILDTWIRREEADVKAFPLGRVLHIVPGNVPMSTTLSILRALITKNVSIIKSSSSDLVTPIFIALSFLDIDAMHPIARSINVIHWESSNSSSDSLIRNLVQSANGLCAWGSKDAMNWASEQSLYTDAEIIKFGPKRSLSILGKDADIKDAARALAHDMCVYDQKGCFSVRQVFTQIDPQLILEELTNALNLYQDVILPKGIHSVDENAVFSLILEEAKFLGSNVIKDYDGSWSIVIAPPVEIEEHPLGRTVFLHHIDKFEEIEKYIDRSVQTVTLCPWNLSFDLRDKFARLGVSRIVDFGMNNIFRIGSAHDGSYPLQKFVRYASVELSSDHYLKGINIPTDQTSFLEENKFASFIP